MEQERPDLLKQRRDWCDSRGNRAADRLVFLDETGLSTKMSRLRGRSTCGKRCRAEIHMGIGRPQRLLVRSGSRG